MSSQWHGGKGSSPRPLSVSQKEYEDRWDAIFQRDLKTEEEEQKESVAEKEKQKEQE
jgi:hypothetical protein